MPLSKKYTLKDLRGIIILWLDQTNISELNPDLVEDFVHIAVNDTFQEQADQIMQEYGRTQDLSDVSAAFNAVSIVGGALTYTLKKITKTAHGLTASDIGKRIIFGRSVPGDGTVTYATIANILTIIDADNFTVSHVPNTNIPANTLFYAVLPAHSTAMLDISALEIYKIRHLIDSLNGEVIEVKDAREFENLSRYPQKQNKIYYRVHGETIQLYKGSNITAYGTLTLHYYGYPAKPATEDDYIDMKDFRIPNVIQKIQNYILAYLKKQSINTFDPNSASKSEKSRQIEASSEGQLATKR